MTHVMTTERQLGAAIRQARTEAGLTQSELAELAGVSRAFVSGMESASRPGAELRRVLAILRALELGIVLERDHDDFESALEATLSESAQER